MATPEAAAAAAAHQALLEQLDTHSIHKHFRRATWKPGQRRNKNIKTILGDASRNAASSAVPTPQTGALTPNDDGLSTSGASTPATAAPQSASGSTAQPNLAQASRSLSKLVLEKSLRPAGTNGAVPGVGVGAPTATYTNIESAPSLAPTKRYCDITGLPAPYSDPKSRLRYHNMEVFSAIRGFQTGVAEQYLETRGAHTVLK